MSKVGFEYICEIKLTLRVYKQTKSKQRIYIDTSRASSRPRFSKISVALESIN